MQHTFVTLFDKNYLTRGLALYNSLEKKCPAFILYILAMDIETGTWIKENIQSIKKNIIVINLIDIENCYPELKRLKNERNRAEYCWTLTPYSIQYVLKKYKTSACTYLDSDIYFFNSPDLIINEVKKQSVIITEHNYTPRYDQSEISGKYCVQFMYFKNNEDGNKVLEWWRKRCKEWCLSKPENGKFGDQKYLDDWITRFDCIYVPTMAGAGLAPWNIQKYNIKKDKDILYVQDKITQKKEELIFYHFHGLKEYKTANNAVVWYLTEYELAALDKTALYTPYIKLLQNLNKQIPEHLKYSPNIIFDKPISNLKIIIKILKNFVKSFLFISKFKAIKQEYYAERINKQRKFYIPNIIIDNIQK
ncbi:hypothetical protein [Treponema lecithinolyticum]